MRKVRLVCAFSLALLGAAAMAEAKGRPEGLPPSNPPDGVFELLCWYFPDLPFCAD
jgi:hypothetical protein